MYFLPCSRTHTRAAPDDGRKVANLKSLLLSLWMCKFNMSRKFFGEVLWQLFIDFCLVATCAQHAGRGFWELFRSFHRKFHELSSYRDKVIQKLPVIPPGDVVKNSFPSTLLFYAFVSPHESLLGDFVSSSSAALLFVASDWNLITIIKYVNAALLGPPKGDLRQRHQQSITHKRWK